MFPRQCHLERGDVPRSALQNRIDRETTIDKTPQHPEVIHLVNSLVQEGLRSQALCESDRFIAGRRRIEDGTAEPSEEDVPLAVEKDVFADQISMNAVVFMKIVQSRDKLWNNEFHMRFVEVTIGLHQGVEIAT